MNILFASMPMDGHFNPLTGLAVHLRGRGHDVRWYTGPSYAAKLAKLGVPHLPFCEATDLNGDNLVERFPEYARLSGPKAIAFALERIFFGNTEAHLKDIRALRAQFPFDTIVFDGAFYAGRLVHETFSVPAYPIWPAPTPAPRSQQTPPPFFGLRPMRGPLGKLRDAVVSALLNGSMKGGMKMWHALRARAGLPPFAGHIFDVHNETSRAMFMTGVPGMDFPRTDWPAQIRFVGALLPHQRAGGELSPALAEKVKQYAGRVVVVSQGTIDNRDATKLFVPALQALAGSDQLVVVTTGGLHTAELRARFGSDNVVIEDFIPFDVLMPHASLFICNGGYGSVMQAVVHGVPLLVAGELEAKNDINARLADRGLALDLRTERPTARQIAAGAARVLADGRFRQRVQQVREELASYDAFQIIERAIVAGADSQAIKKERRAP